MSPVESHDLPDDLLTPEAVADPDGAAAVLRAHDPVHWSATHRAWLVTRFDDVVAAFKNPALSSDRVRPLMSARAAGDRPSGDASQRMLGLISEWMVVTDPPAHTRLRRLAGAAFKQQQIAAMEERIQTLVDGLVDAFLADGGTDLVAGVAYPLPAIVIAEMLGAPPEDRDRFRSWSDELALVAFGAGGDARPDRHERALRGLEEMAGYFRTLVAHRRRDPGGDMLSAMIGGDDPADEEGLSDDELVGMCALLLFAGHETTTNAIANAVRLLTADPELRDRVRDDPALVAPAVEEALRLVGPIKVLVRWVIEDHELRGHTIRAGERVYLLLCGANRDPERFTDPDVVDLARSRATHIAFGRGVHACIGAQLARIETRIAVGTLLRRLPGLRVEGEPAYLPTIASRAQESLPVVHDGAPAASRS